MQMLAYPCDDTAYDAEALGLDKAVRSRGVFAAGDCLSLSAAGGMAVTLSPGLCNLKMDEYWGVTARLKAACTFTLDASDGVLSRYDIIRARLDKATQVAECEVRKGTPSSAPSMPVTPQRDANADEIYLHAVYVGAGALEITAANITDLRLNETVCGLMSDGVTRIPTAQISAQATSLINTLQKALADVQDGAYYAHVDDFTATLSPTGWSATAPYTQTVAVTGMVDTMEPICDIVLTGTAADAAALEAYACVSRIASGANSITVTCLDDKPGAAINLKFKVVR